MDDDTTAAAPPSFATCGVALKGGGEQGQGRK